MNTPPPLPSSDLRWVPRFLVMMAIVAFLVAVGVGVVVKVRQKAKEAEGMKAFQAAAQSQREEVRNSDDAVVGASERMDKMGKALETLSSSLQGREKKAVAALQTVITDMKPHLRHYEETYKQLDAAGFHSPKGLVTKADIASRRALADQFRLANEKLAESQSGMEKKARARLVAEGLPESYVDQVLKGYVRSSHMAQMLQIREQDKKLCQLVFETLDLFTQQFGKWNYSAEKGLIFDDSSTLAQYQGIQEQIQAVAKEQASVQKQILAK